MDESDSAPSEPLLARVRVGDRVYAVEDGAVVIERPEADAPLKLGATKIEAQHLAVHTAERYVAVASETRAVVYFVEGWEVVADVTTDAPITALALEAKDLVITTSAGERREAIEPADPEEPEDEPPLVLRGNKVRWLSGGAVTLTGLLLGILFVILPWSSRAGVALGVFATLLSTKGVLLLLGCFDDRGEHIEARALARPLAVTTGGAIATIVALRLAVGGILQPASAAVVVPAAFLGLVAGLGMTLQAFQEDGDARPWYRREGFWLLAFATFVLLPALGSKSLTDPWETHYGEVAREILARQDWISLWWAHEKWFMSKPILGFWMQSIAMAVLGVRYEPGRMLSAAAEGHLPWPEWAVRFPVFLFAIAATYVLYKAIARVFGRRAGLLGGVVLTTMPQWFFVTHQTMTDLPFVATMSAALGFFLIGAHEHPERLVRVRELVLGPLRIGISARHLLLGVVLAVSIPQIVYLVTRNLELAIDPVFGLRMPPIQPVGDSFVFGSADNCGSSPGNPACAQHIPAFPRFHPALQALLWAQALGIFLWLSWGERRARRIAFLAAFFCAALSTMAKGPAGLVLPAAAVGCYLLATRRWRLLLDLEIAAGSVLMLPVAMPWFVAMYVRHGSEFTDRLFFYDMVKRAFDQAHDTNEGQDTSFRYYIGQLGYGTFPWIGLLPAALFGRPKTSAEQAETPSSEREVDARGTIALLVAWFVVTFTLFAYMKTKFHHYVLPALPALSLLAGIALDRLLGASPIFEGKVGRRNAAIAIALGPGVALGALLSGAATWTGMLAYAALGGVAVVGAAFVSREGAEERGAGAVAESAAGGAALLAGATLALLVGRDLAADRVDQPSDARLLHLFTYNYDRDWPEHLDFSGPLWAFTFAAGLFLLVAVAPRLRRGALLAFAGVATAFAAWALDAYFVKASPHWGQRELVLRYVEENAKTPGPLVAYQMNWKGENFYTGNQVAILLDRGREAKGWFSARKKKKQKVFYVVTTHGLEQTLKGDLGKSATIEPLTTQTDNNKFVLVRAQVP